jgi:hypothetical protein
MPTDPKKITESRKSDRERFLSPEERQAHALEQIADTLEAIRMDFVSFQHMMASSQMRQGGV